MGEEHINFIKKKLSKLNTKSANKFKRGVYAFILFCGENYKSVRNLFCAKIIKVCENYKKCAKIIKCGDNYKRVNVIIKTRSAFKKRRG